MEKSDEAHRPKLSRIGELLRAMIAAPAIVSKALNLAVGLRPLLSMIRLAIKLPESPPTVKIEVTTEKVKWDMGMHVGKP